MNQSFFRSDVLGIFWFLKLEVYLNVFRDVIVFSLQQTLLSISSLI